MNIPQVICGYIHETITKFVLGTGEISKLSERASLDCLVSLFMSEAAIKQVGLGV